MYFFFIPNPFRIVCAIFCSFLIKKGIFIYKNAYNLSRIKCINNFCFHIFFLSLFFFYFIFLWFRFPFCVCVCVCVSATSYYYDFLSQYLKTSVTLQSTTCTWIIIIVIKTNTKFDHNVIKRRKINFRYVYLYLQSTMKDFLFYFKLRTFFCCRECHFLFILWFSSSPLCF